MPAPVVFAKNNWQATNDTKPEPQDLDDLANSILNIGVAGQAPGSIQINYNSQDLVNLRRLAFVAGGYLDGNFAVGAAAAKINGAVTPHTRITRLESSLHVGSSGTGSNDEGLVQLGSYNFLFGNNQSGFGGVGRNLAAKTVGGADVLYTPVSNAGIGYQALVFDTGILRFYAATGATTAGQTVTPTPVMTVNNAGLLTVAAVTLSGAVTAGSMALSGAATLIGSVSVRGNPGAQRTLTFQSIVTGTPRTRWNLITDEVGEDGADAGSNLRLLRYNDAGVSLGDALSINRAHGYSIHTGKFGGPGDGTQFFITRFGQNSGLGCIDVGFGSGAHGWLQARNANLYSTTYGLQLNPVGGDVIIGPGRLVKSHPGPYDSNAAAVAAGLTSGMHFRDSNGFVRQVV